MKICKWHTCNNVVVGRANKTYCSNKCQNKGSVSKRRRAVKVKLVDHFGGKCVKCGYDKSYAALQFHHRDSEEKEFGIADRGLTIAYDRLLREAGKCDLLCANCHAEEHSQGSL